MKMFKRNHALGIIALVVAMAGSAAGVVIIAGGEQGSNANRAKITILPQSQTVAAGSDVAYLAVGEDLSSYQWLCNETPMPDETNALLFLQNVQTNDAGYFSCEAVDEGGNVITSSAASLLVYVVLDPDPIVVVYALPITSSGGSGSCPGPYKGYVTYTTNSFGWSPSTNTTIYTATDTNRSNTKVEYVGDYGDSGCAKTSVTIPYPPASTSYIFSICFTNNVPTNSYAITLSGFNP